MSQALETDQWTGLRSLLGVHSPVGEKDVTRDERAGLGAPRREARGPRAQKGDHKGRGAVRVTPGCPSCHLKNEEVLTRSGG